MNSSKILICVLALLLALAGCAKAEDRMTPEESAALEKASEYFAWSLQTLEEEYTISYEPEVRIGLEGRDCYLFRAEDPDGTVLVYAAVPGEADELWYQFTPEAPWQKVAPETWEEIELWTEGVG